MIESNTVYANRPLISPISRVSWGAIFTGLFLSLATYLFLGVLGTAVGSAAIDATGDRNPLAGFGTGAGVWVGVSTLIALAVGGFFAGRTAPGKGILHGVLSWAVTTLVTVYALSSLAGGVIGTATRVAGAGLSAAGSLAGQGVAAVAPDVASGVKGQLQKDGVDFDFAAVRNQLETLLRQSGKAELNPDVLQAKANDVAQAGQAAASQAAAAPQDSGNDLSAFFDRLRQKAQPTLDAADKDALINIIAARTGKSRAEAEQIATNYQQTYEQAVAKFNELKAQAEQKAREAADAAAKGVSQAAWAGVAIMLVGVLLSGAAGYFGRRSALRDEVIVAV